MIALHALVDNKMTIGKAELEEGEKKEKEKEKTETSLDSGEKAESKKPSQ